MEGTHNQATVKDFYGAFQDDDSREAMVFELDEPPVLCGDNLGANPLEYLLVALSGCLTTSLVAHAAAKGAMDSIAKVMATELGPQGVTVNVIGPGLTLTDATKHQPREMHEQIASFTPLRRLGMPDDVAGVAVFLASRLSDYVNGQYIPVNGGAFMV